MTFEDYVAAQRVIVARLVLRLLAILNPFKGVTLGPGSWIGLLSSMFMQVDRSRTESAELARQFYDSERERMLGTPERHPAYLAEYDPDWFQEAMEPAREAFSKSTASDADLMQVISIAIKETENGGRRTNLRAVDTDPKTIGWARAEGGGESCAFCLMLISRGPVYKDARDAGLDAGEVSAVEIWKRAEDSGNDEFLMQLMTRWHPNCDCKVVPVFNRASWTGRDRFLAAEKLWAAVTGPFSGVDKLNAFRRAVEAAQKSEQDSPSRIRPAA